MRVRSWIVPVVALLTAACGDREASQTGSPGGESSGQVRRLTDGDTDDFVCDWTPDGAAFLYAARREFATDIFLRPLDGGEELRFTEGTGPQLRRHVLARTVPPSSSSPIATAAWRSTR